MWLDVGLWPFYFVFTDTALKVVGRKDIKKRKNYDIEKTLHIKFIEGEMADGIQFNAAYNS